MIGATRREENGAKLSIDLDSLSPQRGLRTQPRVSTRFQPWEIFNNTVRPERARAHVV